MRKNIKLIKHAPDSTKNIHQESKIPRLSTPLSVRNNHAHNMSETESASIKKKIIKLTNQNNRSFDLAPAKQQFQNTIKQCSFFEANKASVEQFHGARILETPTLKPKQNPLKNYHPTQDSDRNSSRKFSLANMCYNQQISSQKQNIQKHNNSTQQCTGELTFRSKQLIKPYQQSLKKSKKIQSTQNIVVKIQPNISEFDPIQTQRSKGNSICHHHPTKMASYFIKQLNQTDIYVCWSCAMKLSRQGYDIRPIKGNVAHHTLIELKSMNVMAPILQAKPSQQNNSFLVPSNTQQYTFKQYENQRREQTSRERGRQFNKQKSLIKVDKHSAKKERNSLIRDRSDSIEQKNQMNNQINKFLSTTSNYIMKIAHQYEKISQQQAQQDYNLEKQLDKLQQEKQQEIQAIKMKYNLKQKLAKKKFEERELQLQTQKNCLQIYLQRLLTAKEDVSMNKKTLETGRIKKQQFENIMMVYWEMIQDANKIQFTQRNMPKNFSSNKKSQLDTHDKKFNFTLSGKKNTAVKFSGKKCSESKNSRQSTNSKAYPFVGVAFPLLKMINSTTSEGNISVEENSNQSLVKEQYKF